MPSRPPPADVPSAPRGQRSTTRRMLQDVDAAHVCCGTVAYLVEQRHASYALRGKGNHAALSAAVPEVEGHVQTERSHGPIIRPSVWAAPLPDQPTLTLSWGHMAESRSSAIHSGRRIAKWSGRQAADSVVHKCAGRIDSPDGPSARRPLSVARKIS